MTRVNGRSPLRTIHQKGCPVNGEHSDAAKKIADTYNLHRAAQGYDCIGFWFAAALQDGSTDGVLYDSKQSAIMHQHHNENFYTYIQIVPSTMHVCEAETMIRIARMLYDKGWRMTDGSSRVDLIRRLTIEDQIALANGVVTNIRRSR